MTSMLVRAADALVRAVTAPVTIATIATLAVLTFLLIAYERVQGRDYRRYWTREFLTDLEYALFYNAGIFALLWWPAHRLLTMLTGADGLALTAGLRPSVQFVLFLIVSDAALYWKHRTMHAVPALWRIHAIHHSQRNMTLLTSFRFHAADELISNVVRLAVALILGIPPAASIPATIVLTVYQSLQHSDTGWTFGLLDRIFVSSRFHNVHHSVDAAAYRSNFGLVFSAWDFLFRTASAGRPSRYGVIDLDVPESFSSQLVFPFRRHASPAAGQVAAALPNE